MNENQLKEKLHNAMAHQVPDVLDNILLQCDTEKGETPMTTTITNLTTKKSKSIYKTIVSIAAMLVLTIGAVSVAANAGLNRVETVVAFDVNPSIEIEVNKNEKVIDVNALNADARRVIDDMDLVKTDLNVAVNAILGSMLKHGYLSVNQNSILVTVHSNDTAKAEQLRQSITADVETILKGSNIEASVLTQVTNDILDDNAEKIAEQNHISKAKAALIEKITAAGLKDTKGTAYTQEQLAALTVNELKLLMETKEIQVANLQSSGHASENLYIGRDEALHIASIHAGITADTINRPEIEMDYEHGLMVYEVEFNCNGLEYDYEINALNGEIIKSEKEVDDDYIPTPKPTRKPEPTAAIAPTETPEPTVAPQPTTAPEPTKKPEPTATPKPTTVPTEKPAELIGEQTALAIALAHAGINQTAASRIQCELDKDDNRLHYEVEFDTRESEYDYEIDAYTGEILKSEAEPHDDDDREDWDDRYDDDWDDRYDDDWDDRYDD